MNDSAISIHSLTEPTHLSYELCYEIISSKNLSREFIEIDIIDIIEVNIEHSDTGTNSR